MSDDAKVQVRISAKDDATAVFDKLDKKTSEWKERTAAAFKHIAAAGALAFGAVAKGVKDAIDRGDQIDELSQKLGLTTETLSILGYQARFSGLELTGVANAVKFLLVNLEEARNGGNEAAETFQRLGITTEAYGRAAGDQMRLIEDIAEQFKAMENGSRKAEIATRLFGRSGLDMIPMLNEGIEGLRKAAGEAREFGLVLNAEQAKAAASVSDGWERMKAAWEGFTETLSGAAFETDVGKWWTGQLASAQKTYGLYMEVHRKAAELSRQLAIDRGNAKDQGFQNVEDYREFLNFLKTEPPQSTLRDRVRDAQSFYAEREAAARREAHEHNLVLEEQSQRLKNLGTEWAQVSEYAEAWFDVQERIAEQSRRRDALGGIRLALDEARDYYDDWQLRAREATKTFLDGVNSDWDQYFLRAMEERTFRVQEIFASLVRNLQRMLAKQAADGLSSLLVSGLGSIFGSAGPTRTSTGVEVYGPTAPPAPPQPIQLPVDYEANGGPVAAGRAYVVGERRPELFIPGRDGHIVPDARGGGGGHTFNVQVSAVDAKSFLDLAASNPEAFAVMVVNVLSTNPQIAQAMRGALS